MNERLDALIESGILAKVQTAKQAKACYIGEMHACMLPVGKIVAREMEEVHRECPDLLLGVYDVCTTEQVGKAADAAADFVLCSVCEKSLLEYCRDKNLPAIPQVKDNNDIKVARSCGFEVLGYVVTDLARDKAYLSSRQEMDPTLRFVLLGNVEDVIIISLLNLKNVIACARMVARQATICSKAVTEKAKRLLHSVLGFDIAHIGMNFDDDSKAFDTAKHLATLFGLALTAGAPSFFAGTIFECVKAPYIGEKGHVAISTNNIELAEAYLLSHGVCFNENTRQYLPDGRLRAVYFAEDIAGFVIHLLQK